MLWLLILILQGRSGLSLSRNEHTCWRIVKWLVDTSLPDHGHLWLSFVHWAVQVHLLIVPSHCWLLCAQSLVRFDVWRCVVWGVWWKLLVSRLYDVLIVDISQVFFNRWRCVPGVHSYLEHGRNRLCQVSFCFFRVSHTSTNLNSCIWAVNFIRWDYRKVA